MIEETVVIPFRSGVAAGAAADARALRTAAAAAAEYEHAADSAGRETRETEAALRAQERELARSQAAFLRLARDLDPAIRAQERLARSTATLDRALRSGAVSQTEHARLMGLATVRASEMSQTAARVSSAQATVTRSTLGAASAMRTMIAAYAAYRAISIVRDIVETGMAWEGLRARLETAEGSQQRAAVFFERIREFAANTPFEIDQVTAAWITLRNVGIEPTMPLLTSLGNIAGANLRTIDDVAAAARGVLTGETERMKAFGVTARLEGDKVKFIFRGVTTEVGRNAEEIAGYLEKLGATEFAGGMERQAATLTGRISNLSDAWSQFADTAFNSELSSALRDAVAWLTETTSSGETTAEALGGALADAVRALSAVLQFLVANASNIKSILQLLVAVRLTGWALSGADAISRLASGAAAAEGASSGLALAIARIHPALLLAIAGAVAFDRVLDGLSAKMDRELAGLTAETRGKQKLEIEIELAIASGSEAELGEMERRVQGLFQDAAAELGAASVEATRYADVLGQVRANERSTAQEIQGASDRLAEATQRKGKASAAADTYAKMLHRVEGAARAAGAADRGPPDDVPRRYESATARLREEIRERELQLAAIGRGEQAERAAVAAAGAMAAAEKLGAGATREMREEVMRLSTELSDLDERIRKATASEERHRAQLTLLRDATRRLATAQDELAAAERGGEEAVERLRVVQQALAEALESGLSILDPLTVRHVGLAIEADRVARSTQTVIERQREATEVGLATMEAVDDLAQARRRERILLDEGADALRRYDEEMRAHRQAIRETSSAFGRDVSSGPPTREESEYYRGVRERLATEQRTALTEASVEAAEEGAREYEAIWLEAFHSLAQGGWDDWEQVGKATITRLIQWQAQQQAQQQAYSAAIQAGASEQEAQQSGAQAGASAAGWAGAAIAIFAAFWEWAGARQEERQGKRPGLNIVATEGEGEAFRSHQASVSLAEAQRLAREMGQVYAEIVRSLGAAGQDLDRLQLEVTNNGKKFTVSVGDWTREFGSLAEALDAGFRHLVGSIDPSTLSQPMASVVNAVRTADSGIGLDEIRAMIEQARRIEAIQGSEAEVGVRAVEREVLALFDDLVFRVEDVLAVWEDGLRGIRDGILSEIRGLIPGTDALARVEQLQRLQREAEGYNRQYAESLARVTAAAAEAALTEEGRHYTGPPGLTPGPGVGGSPLGGGLNPNEMGGGGPSGGGGMASTEEQWDAVTDILLGSLKETAEAVETVGEAVEQATKPLALAGDAAGELAIDMQELANAQIAVQASIEQSLASSLLEHTRDARLRGRLQQAEHALLMLQLEAQYAALVALGTLSQEVLGVYRAAIDEVGAQGPRARGGGGGQRQEQRESLREILEEWVSGMAMAGGAAVQIQAFREETARLAREMRQLGAATAEEIAAFVAARREMQALMSRGAELDLLERLAQALGDEALAAEVAAARRELELAHMRLQVETLLALGFLSETAAARIRHLIDQYEELPPPGSDAGEKPAPAVRPEVMTIDEIRQELGDAIGELEERARRTREAMDQLAGAVARGEITMEAAAEILRRAGDALFVGLADDLVGFARRYYGESALSAEQLMRLEEARWTLELAHMQMQIQLAEELGLLTAEQVVWLRGVMGELTAERPDFGAIVQRQYFGGGGGGSGGGGAAAGIEDLTGAVERLLELRRRYAGGSRLDRDLLDLRRVFDESRGLEADLRGKPVALQAALRELGLALDEVPDAAELEELRAVALREFFADLDSDLRSVIDDLRGTGDPSLSPQARYMRAQTRFEDLLARAQAGDLEARAELGDALRELQESAAANFGTATLMFQQILQAALERAEAILGMLPDVPPAPIPPPPASLTGQAAAGSGPLGGRGPGSGREYYDSLQPPPPPPPPPSGGPLPGEKPIAAPPPGGSADKTAAVLDAAATRLSVQLAAVDASLREISLTLARKAA